MSNAGLIPGLNPDGWKRYETSLSCAGAGGEVQPVVDTTSYAFGNPSGRYLIADHNYVIVEIQLTFTGTFSFGSGAAWVFKLPFPANRWSGEHATAPIPLGLGMSYFSFNAPEITVPMAITLADPHASLGGTEDNYVQCYCPNIIGWGSQANGSATVATVTHQLGFAPRAEDIDLTPTNVGSVTSGTGIQTIQNITTTTFDIVTNGSSGAIVTAWKAKAKPPAGATSALLSPTVPWDWTRGFPTGPGGFGNIFLQFAYEPRR